MRRVALYTHFLQGLWHTLEREKEREGGKRVSFIRVVTATIPMRATHKVSISQAVLLQEHFAHRFVERNGCHTLGCMSPGPWLRHTDAELTIKTSSFLLQVEFPSCWLKLQHIAATRPPTKEQRVLQIFGVWKREPGKMESFFFFKPSHDFGPCVYSFKVTWFSVSVPQTTVFVILSFLPWMIFLFFFFFFRSGFQWLTDLCDQFNYQQSCGRPDEFTRALKWDLSSVNSYRKLIWICFLF